jgi:hypothetical protein
MHRLLPGTYFATKPNIQSHFALKATAFNGSGGLGCAKLISERSGSSRDLSQMAIQ